MDYNISDVDKIVGFKTWTDKKKIDALLEMDSKLYCNLGSDSTKKEREEVRKSSRIIYTAIKKIDHQMGNNFLQSMDNQ